MERTVNPEEKSRSVIQGLKQDIQDLIGLPDSVGVMHDWVRNYFVVFGETTKAVEAMKTHEEQVRELERRWQLEYVDGATDPEIEDKISIAIALCLGIPDSVEIKISPDYRACDIRANGVNVRAGEALKARADEFRALANLILHSHEDPDWNLPWAVCIDGDWGASAEDVRTLAVHRTHKKEES